MGLWCEGVELGQGEDICLTQNGIPPRDLLESVAAALIAAGIRVDEFFEMACKVTGDWKYDPSKARLKDRIDQKYNHERSVPLKFRTLAECLNPQPDAHVVFQRLLNWIDRCDVASQMNLTKPQFQAADGGPIFPDDEDDQWWLTDVSKRIATEDRQGDEDGPMTGDEAGNDEMEQREISDDDPLSEPEGNIESSQPHCSSVAWNSQ